MLLSSSVQTSRTPAKSKALRSLLAKERNLDIKNVVRKSRENVTQAEEELPYVWLYEQKAFSPLAEMAVSKTGFCQQLGSPDSRKVLAPTVQTV